MIEYTSTRTSTSACTPPIDRCIYISQESLWQLAHVIMEAGKVQDLQAESANWRPSPWGSSSLSLTGADPGGQTAYADPL